MTYISHNKHNQLIVSSVGFPANETFAKKYEWGSLQTSRFSLETQINFLKTPDCLQRPGSFFKFRVFNENIGVSKENLQGLNENLGSPMNLFGSPMKTWGSTTKIWSVNEKLAETDHYPLMVGSKGEKVLHFPNCLDCYIFC